MKGLTLAVCLIVLPALAQKDDPAPNRKAFDAITAQQIKETFTRKNDSIPRTINGSDNKDNQLRTGAIILYRTDAGRFGKLQVVEYAYNLKVRWVTYDEKNAVFARGDSLVMRGTFAYDLDYGAEGRGGKSQSDVFWQQKTKTARYFLPQNRAAFLVHDPKEKLGPQPEPDK